MSYDVIQARGKNVGPDVIAPPEGRERVNGSRGLRGSVSESNQATKQPSTTHCSRASFKLYGFFFLFFGALLALFFLVFGDGFREGGGGGFGKFFFWWQY